LDGALHLLLLALRDVVSDGFCSALHRFRGHIQAGQDLDLFATVIEGNALAHESLHTAHARGELRVLDVQFDIDGELALVTVPAQVIGP
jgi:hypothetical protein